VVTNRVARNKVQLLHSEKAGQTGLAGACLLDTAMAGVSRVYGGNALNLGFTEHDSRAAVEAQPRDFPQGTGRCEWDAKKLAADFAAADFILT